MIILDHDIFWKPVSQVPLKLRQYARPSFVTFGNKLHDTTLRSILYWQETKKSHSNGYDVWLWVNLTRLNIFWQLSKIRKNIKQHRWSSIIKIRKLPRLLQFYCITKWLIQWIGWLSYIWRYIAHVCDIFLGIVLLSIFHFVNPFPQRKVTVNVISF